MGTAGPVHVVIYLDEAYAVPATVLVLSMLRHFGPGDPLHLHVLGVGLTEATRQTMTASWPAHRAVVRWIDVEFTADAAGCLPTGYLSRAAYARLLIDRYLPVEIGKVLTVDTDGLLLADVRELWQRAPARACLMAVRDSFVRTLADDPSPFIQRDLTRQDAPCFNSGLMLIDMRRWRQQRIGQRCLDLAACHPGEAAIGDNSLLNAVLAGAWEPLPLRWNCSTRHLEIHGYPSLRDLIHPRGEVVEATRNPAFLHFVSKYKPWHVERHHPDRRIYARYLAQTAWSRAGGTPFPSSLRARWQSVAYPWQCYRRARAMAARRRDGDGRAADAAHLVRGLVGRRAGM